MPSALDNFKLADAADLFETHHTVTSHNSFVPFML
jgi:hypothetical protein